MLSIFIFTLLHSKPKTAVPIWTLPPEWSPLSSDLGESVVSAGSATGIAAFVGPSFLDLVQLPVAAVSPEQRRIQGVGSRAISYAQRSCIAEDARGCPEISKFLSPESSPEALEAFGRYFDSVLQRLRTGVPALRGTART